MGPSVVRHAYLTTPCTSHSHLKRLHWANTSFVCASYAFLEPRSRGRAEKLKRKRQEYEELHREELAAEARASEARRRLEALLTEQRQLIAHIMARHASFYDLLQVRADVLVIAAGMFVGCVIWCRAVCMHFLFCSLPCYLLLILQRCKAAETHVCASVSA